MSGAFWSDGLARSTGLADAEASMFRGAQHAVDRTFHATTIPRPGAAQDFVDVHAGCASEQGQELAVRLATWLGVDVQLLHAMVDHRQTTQNIVRRLQLSMNMVYIVFFMF